jgi:hypothetical protein
VVAPQNTPQNVTLDLWMGIGIEMASQNTPQNIMLNASCLSPLEGRPLWRVQRHNVRGVLEFHIDPHTHPHTQHHVLRGVL